MSKTIEEMIYDFANRQFHKAPINTARDLMCVCSDFANEFLAQPLSSRLTAEEKERVRKMYTECELIEMDDSPNLPADRITEATAKIQVLESIFGTDFFKEGE